MPDHWATISFDVSSKILGCDIEFHDGTKPTRLNQKQATKKLFYETRSGKKFDTGQMISSLLKKSNTRKQDLIKPAAAAEAFEKGICIGKPDLSMSFTPGSVSLLIKGQAD